MKIFNLILTMSLTVSSAFAAEEATVKAGSEQISQLQQQTLAALIMANYVGTFKTYTVPQLSEFRRDLPKFLGYTAGALGAVSFMGGYIAFVGSSDRHLLETTSHKVFFHPVTGVGISAVGSLVIGYLYPQLDEKIKAENGQALAVRLQADHKLDEELSAGLDQWSTVFYFNADQIARLKAKVKGDLADRLRNGGTPDSYNVVDAAKRIGLIDENLAESYRLVMKSFLSGSDSDKKYSLEESMKLNLSLAEKTLSMLKTLQSATVLESELQEKLNMSVRSLEHKINAAKAFQAAMN